MEIHIGIDIQEPVRIFTNMLKRNERRNVMSQVKYAGADVIRNEMWEKAPIGMHKSKYYTVRGEQKLRRPIKKSLKVKRQSIFRTRNANYWALANVPHAMLIEFGHGGPHPAPPHPFIRPAVDASRNEAIRAARDKFEDAIASQLKKKARATLRRRVRSVL